MAERMVIVGAGQAGAQTAISLRQLGFDGRIALLGDEPYPPYQRPPLSKKLMTGEMDVERTYISSAGLLRQERGGAAAGRAGRRIDRGRPVVLCDDGAALAYDVLVLCTGTRARRLDLPGGDLPGVLYLRTLAIASVSRRPSPPAGGP